MFGNDINKKIRVLAIDDSAFVRKMITDMLSNDTQIELVATAPDPIIGRDKIVEFEPDVLLLDVEMPRMDGLSFLQILMTHKPMPVIIVSSLATRNSDVVIRALELGASEIVLKPSTAYSIQDVGDELKAKIKAVSKIKVFSKPKPIQRDQIVFKPTIKTTNKIIAIGASTGGTEAIKEVLMGLPVTSPPIVIVQHMPQNFTKAFAERLNSICALNVKEAENGDLLSPGKALLAPGNYHMVLKKSGIQYFVEIKNGPPVFHQRPAVEVLFVSVAKVAGQNAVGVLLTGMGKDGAQGLLEMKNAGGYTMAQDEATSVVFGMPKEAINIGGANEVVPLQRMSERIISAVQKIS